MGFRPVLTVAFKFQVAAGLQPGGRDFADRSITKVPAASMITLHLNRHHL